MATWDTDAPADSIDADTLHTAIQTCRSDIMDRAKCDNGDFEEHDFYDSGATGLHVSSRVGFVKAHTDFTAFLVDFNAGNCPDNSVHYIVSGAEKGIYICYGGSYYTAVISDHGQLSGLGDDDHSQYMRTDGTRAATGDMTILTDGALSVTTIGTEDDGPIDEDHVDLSWYSAHGANGLEGNDWADDGLEAAAVNIITGASFSESIANNVIDGYAYWRSSYGFFPVVRPNEAPPGGLTYGRIAYYPGGYLYLRWRSQNNWSGSAALSGKTAYAVSGGHSG